MASPELADDASPLDDFAVEARPKPSQGPLLAFLKGKPRTDAGSTSGSRDELTSLPVPEPSASNGPKQPPRKRRKKADEGQARLMKVDGGGWAFGKASATTAAEEGESMGGESNNHQNPATGSAEGEAPGRPNTAKRKQGRKDLAGEAAEVKEMAQKMRKTMAKRGRPKGATASRQGHDIVQATAEETVERPRRTASRSASPRKASNRTGRATNGATAGSLDGRAARTSPPIIHLGSDEADANNGASFDGSRFDHHLPNPFLALSRATSVTSRGSTHMDAIELDEEEEQDADAPVVVAVKQKQPRKLVFAADQQRTTHSFFNRGQPGPLTGTSSEPLVSLGAGESTQREGPQDVPTPMVKSQSAQGKGKKQMGAAHPFFSSAGRVEPGKLKDGWGNGVKAGEEWNVPLPGVVWPGHVGLSDPQAGPSTVKLPTRTRPRVAELVEEDYWKATKPSKRRRLPSPLPTHVELPPIPATSSDHPAITSARRRISGPNRATWADKYRPLAARQVLGNETESVYLRDWLKALAVGHEQKIRITRKAPRSCSDLIDGWIVDDIARFSDDEDDPDNGTERERFETIYEAPLSFDKRPEQYPPFTTRLANTMLLTGPSGSGKSAAVYAAAEELGWEVFEVYPGIGKRTGGALMNLVGDVGKNHIVAQTKSPGKAKPTVNPFFGNGKASQGHGQPTYKAKGKTPEDDEVIFVSSSQGSQRDPIDLLASRSDSESEVQNGGEKGYKQSLILLDEVDLLYEEESTFWPAVISLIAESRRPVVLTCNDPERLPIASLPLQAILAYHPPAMEAAVPYLTAIAKQEGLDVGQHDIDRLYRQSMLRPPDLLKQPLPPNGHEVSPTFDLRHALTQLQLDRSAAQSFPSALGKSRDGGQHSNGAEDRGEEATQDVGNTAKTLQYRSYVDAYLEPDHAHLIEVNEIDRYDLATDDILAVRALRKPIYGDRHTTLASIACEQADFIIDELEAACVLRFGHVSGSANLDRLHETRIQYMRSLLPLLDPLIPLGSPLLPASSVFTDILPVIRSIVAADDFLQAEAEAAVERGEDRFNRRTGRPVRVTDALKREEYPRYLAKCGVGKEGEEVARECWVK